MNANFWLIEFNINVHRKDSNCTINYFEIFIQFDHYTKDILG